jgi:hypothetical protein
MASQEDLNRAKQIRDFAKETADLLRGDADTSFSAIDSLKETLKLRGQNTEFEKELLRTAKEVNRAIISQKDSVDSISKFQRELVKNQNLINKANRLTLSIQRSLTPVEKGRLESLQQELNTRDRVLKTIKVQGDLVDTTSGIERQNARQTLNDANDLLATLDYSIDRRQKGLSSTMSEYLFTQLNTKELEKQTDLREKALEALKPSAQFLQILGAIPGLGNVATETLNELLVRTEESLSDGGTLDKTKAFQESFSAGIKSVINPLTAFALLAQQTFVAFSRINEAQVNLQRNLGEALPPATTLTGEFSTQSDVLRTANALVEQFGLNVNAFFSPETIGQASDLAEAVGLSADQAGRLAFFSELNNQNFEEVLDSSVMAINPLLSQRQILEQVGQISSFIALNFGNQVESLVEAASAAKELGLELNQINGIADNLLDIETSIANEFQAELLTGRQINLERARFFALTNDLAGLTEEIGKNQELINSFTTGTRIEQQAIAETLGLDVEALSNMVNQQMALNQMSEFDRERKRLADLETLRNQESIAKSLQKITELSAVLIEPILRATASLLSFVNLIVDGIVYLKTPLLIIGSLVAAFKAQMIGAAIAAGATALFTNPFALAAALGGGILAIAGTVKRNAGDAIIPAGRGPIISTREGGLIQGTTNDDIIMAPGIARGRNAGLSQADVTAIAKAVRDGASQAQINLDGGRVSNRLQPSLAVNTRRYSI